MYKAWHQERRVHLGMKIIHKYQDAFNIYATITHAAKDAKEFLARIINQFKETEKTEWFECLEEAKAYIEKACKLRCYKALKFKSLRGYYNCKLYFYDANFHLIDIFNNLDDFLRKVRAPLDYAKSLFITSKNEVMTNDNRLNFLSSTKFHEKYDRYDNARTRKNAKRNEERRSRRQQEKGLL